MAKDPAFLFYPGDWLGGTMGMTFEEKGAYMELLILQFHRGHMTKHMIGQMVGHLWVNIEDKFLVDSDGKYYNARLDEEKEKRKEFVKSRRNNVLGTNQYTKNKETKEGHMTSHMEDENKNVNTIQSIYETFIKEVKLNNWDTRIEALYMRLKIKKGALTPLLADYQNHLITENRLHKDTNEFFKNFVNWLNTQDRLGKLDNLK